jgi:hypothetical protein
MLPNLSDTSVHLVAPLPRTLTLSITMDNDKVKPVIESEDGPEATGDPPAWRRIQSPEVRHNDIELDAVALGETLDVSAKRFVRGTICQ